MNSHLNINIYVLCFFCELYVDIWIEIFCFRTRMSAHTSGRSSTCGHTCRPTESTRVLLPPFAGTAFVQRESIFNGSVEIFTKSSKVSFTIWVMDKFSDHHLDMVHGCVLAWLHPWKWACVFMNQKWVSDANYEELYLNTVVLLIYLEQTPKSCWEQDKKKNFFFYILKFMQEWELSMSVMEVWWIFLFSLCLTWSQSPLPSQNTITKNVHCATVPDVISHCGRIQERLFCKKKKSCCC